MDNQEFNTDQIGFDSRHCAVVPVAFLDRRLRWYYGHGPHEGEGPVDNSVSPPEPSNAVDLEALQRMVRESQLPQGYVPRGAAKRKVEMNAERKRSTTPEE